MRMKIAHVKIACKQLGKSLCKCRQTLVLFLNMIINFSFQLAIYIQAIVSTNFKEFNYLINK